MSRRCLICSKMNPCSVHDDAAQMGELRRNIAEIDRLQPDGKYERDKAFAAVMAVTKQKG